MAGDRPEVYRRKLAVAAEGLDRIPAEVAGLSRLALDGVLHNVQVVIGVAMDLTAMMVEDRGREVSDDYHNIEILNEEGVVSAALAEELRRLNGLRNALVHRYNTFEEKTLFSKLAMFEEVVLEFAAAVEEVAPR